MFPGFNGKIHRTLKSYSDDLLQGEFNDLLCKDIYGCRSNSEVSEFIFYSSLEHLYKIRYWAPLIL